MLTPKLISTRYIGSFINRFATMCTKWNMHSSRKILLKHFDARAAEYKVDMSRGLINGKQAIYESSDKPVHFSPHYFQCFSYASQVMESS